MAKSSGKSVSGHPGRAAKQRQQQQAAPTKSRSVARRTPKQPPSRVPPVRDPAPGTSYPLVLRVEPTAHEPAPWWRSLLGLMTALLLYAFVVSLVALAVRELAAVFSSQSRDEFLAEANAYENVWGLVSAHLGIAMLIPVSVAIIYFIHRRHPRWLASVVGRVRWGLLGWSLAVSAVVITLVLVVTSWLEGIDYTWGPQAGFWAFLIAIVLLTPFQAAAEEVFFRGYLLQSLGAFARTPWVGILTSAVAFAFFHGVQNPALFADRLAFGVLAGVLVWRTGGLETAIAAHVVNNVFAFTLAGLTSTIAEARALQEITWAAAAADIAGWAVLALALWAVARWRKAEVVVPRQFA